MRPLRNSIYLQNLYHMIFLHSKRLKVSKVKVYLATIRKNCDTSLERISEIPGQKPGFELCAILDIVNFPRSRHLTISNQLSIHTWWRHYFLFKQKRSRIWKYKQTPRNFKHLYKSSVELCEILQIQVTHNASQCCQFNAMAGMSNTKSNFVDDKAPQKENFDIGINFEIRWFVKLWKSFLIHTAFVFTLPVANKTFIAQSISVDHIIHISFRSW